MYESLAGVAIRLLGTRRYLGRRQWPQEIEDDISAQLADGLVDGRVETGGHTFVWVAECETRIPE